jgi:hypothetical protein
MCLPWCELLRLPYQMSIYFVKVQSGNDQHTDIGIGLAGATVDPLLCLLAGSGFDRLDERSVLPPPFHFIERYSPMAKTLLSGIEGFRQLGGMSLISRIAGHAQSLAWLLRCKSYRLLGHFYNNDRMLPEQFSRFFGVNPLQCQWLRRSAHRSDLLARWLLIGMATPIAF